MSLCRDIARNSYVIVKVNGVLARPVTRPIQTSIVNTHDGTEFYPTNYDALAIVTLNISIMQPKSHAKFDPPYITRPNG